MFLINFLLISVNQSLKQKKNFEKEKISLLLTQSGSFESLYGYYEVSLT